MTVERSSAPSVVNAVRRSPRAARPRQVQFLRALRALCGPRSCSSVPRDRLPRLRLGPSAPFAVHTFAPAAVEQYLPRMFYTTMPSPIGELTLTATDDGLTGILFETNRHAKPRLDEWTRATATDGDAPSAVRTLSAVRAQLGEYFAGTRRDFDLPLAAHGTDFQRRVWSALCEIPFGRTTTYIDVARRLGDPAAVRAVGAANGRNPIPIVVPCHRVIGADGSLVGFGGGLETKRRLLDLGAGILTLV